MFAIRSRETDLQILSARLLETFDEIELIAKAHRISMISHSSSGIIARYFTKFISIADSRVRIIAFCGVPHYDTQYLKHLKLFQSSIDFQ
ncbi:MAG: hypothetical protein ACXAC8_08120 [Candidatus Hodarchaeales archaeon]